MDRRSFLGGILAAATAPAIVKADSLMKLWVPDTKVQLVGSFEEFRAQVRKDMETSILTSHELLPGQVLRMHNAGLDYLHYVVTHIRDGHVVSVRPL